MTGRLATGENEVAETPAVSPSEAPPRLRIREAVVSDCERKAGVASGVGAGGRVSADGVVAGIVAAAWG